MSTWQVINLDVWGNPVDGWDLNNWFRTGITIDIPDDCNDSTLVKILKRHGLIKPKIRTSSIRFEDHEDHIYLYDDRQYRKGKGKGLYGNGMPVFNLERVR